MWEIVFCWKYLLSCLVHNDQKLLKECSTQRTDLSIGLFTFFLYFFTLNKWISLLSVSLPIDLYFNFLLFPSLLWNNLFYLSIYIYKFFIFLCLLYSLKMNEHIYAKTVARDVCSSHVTSLDLCYLKLQSLPSPFTRQESP
jgi:hypothetical protein